MRGKNLTAISLVLMLIISLAIVNVGFTQDLTPRAYVDPPMNVVNPGVAFTVNINVENAPETSAWEFKIKWNTDVLRFPPEITEEEGSFLKVWLPDEGRPAQTFLTIKPNQAFGYMMVGSTLLEEVTQYGGAIPSGSGTLASVTFSIQDAGETDLELYDVKLFDYHNPSLITEPTMESGYFHTTVPVASFTWTPATPDVDEVVTFDASASYDPDGTDIILGYTWDFGDGTPIVETTDPVTTHTFTEHQYSPFMVTLTAEDDEHETWSKTKPLTIWHDLAIADVWADASLWLDVATRELRAGFDWMWFVITAYNPGSMDETTDVTLTITHDKTGTVNPGVIIPLWDNPYTIGAGKGSGWDLIALWWGPGMGFDVPSGMYTVTAEIKPVEHEIELGQTANNIMSTSLRLVEADFVMKRITNHAFSITHHGDTLEFVAKAKSLESIDTPEVGVWVRAVCEIMSPEGDPIATLVTDEDLITNEQESKELKATWGPLSEDDVGTYVATAYVEYSSMDFGTLAFYSEVNYIGVPLLPARSAKSKTFSFFIKP